MDLKCVKDIESLIDTKNCNPLLLRLAWSDAVTFDCNSIRKEWPYFGGVNGSIRFDCELELPANLGLKKAITDLLTPIKRKYRSITGGPIIDLNYGRLDMPIELSRAIQSNNTISPSTNSLDIHANPANMKKKLTHRVSLRDYIPPVVLPCPCAPFTDGSPTADAHIRNIFYRLGFNNREIVAICGAHTLGRAFKERSGVCNNSSGDQGATTHTRSDAFPRADGKPGVGMPGGRSWTINWLHFDNSYYKNVLEFCKGNGDNKLLVLPTDAALYECPEFRPYFLKYAQSQDEFFQAYVGAHKKMSELGAKFKNLVTFSIEDVDKYHPS
eukprot:gene25822-34410_t